jgi:hypothetical protein
MKNQGAHLALLMIIPASLLVSSCKKNSTPKATIQVKDVTNSSVVSGAVLGLHRCELSAPLCGVIAYRSGTSGSDGRCSFDQEDFDQTKSVTVSKNGYWLAFEPKSSLINIYPLGWLRLRVIKGTNHPAGAVLKLEIKYGSKLNIVAVNAPADSSILLSGYGGAVNTIDWTVATTSPYTLIRSGSFSQNITRQDTVTYTLNY